MTSTRRRANAVAPNPMWQSSPIELPPRFKEFSLVTERAAVLARLRAADQNAAIPIDLDRLCPAPGRARHHHIVSACLEPIDRCNRRPVLDVGLLAFEEKTWCVDRLLNVHAVVEHIEDDLHV